MALGSGPHAARIAARSVQSRGPSGEPRSSSQIPIWRPLAPFASGMFHEPSRPDAPEAPQPHAERFGGLREGQASGDLFRTLPASASGRRGEPGNPSSRGVRMSPPAVHRPAGPRSGRLRASMRRKGLDSAPRPSARQRAARTSSSRLAAANRCRVASAGAACVHRRKRIPRGRAAGQARLFQVAFPPPGGPLRRPSRAKPARNVGATTAGAWLEMDRNAVAPGLRGPLAGSPRLRP